MAETNASVMRVTACWYAASHGLPCDLEYLTKLGRAAARRARWLGIPAWQVPEGPYLVHSWPEEIWGEVSGAFRDDADRVSSVP